MKVHETRGCFQVKKIFSTSGTRLLENQRGGMFHDVMAAVITAYNNALIAPMLSKVCTRDPGIVRVIKVILNIGVIGSLLCLHRSTLLCVEQPWQPITSVIAAY